jgi:hypothetical protein
MTSVVGICNLALSHLGLDRIDSLTEASAQARASALHYEQARDVMLSAYPWSFAKTAVVLAELTNDWPERWEYRFQRPTDCLKILRLVSAIDLRNVVTPEPHELRGLSIYGRISPSTLEYIRRVSDPTDFSAMFVDALSWQLASRLAMPLTRDPKLRQVMGETAAIMLNEAMAQDANDQPTRPNYLAEQIDAREMGVGTSLREF